MHGNLLKCMKRKRFREIFDRKIYFNQRRKFKSQIKRSYCSNSFCKSEMYFKLQVCSGCMTSWYCSRQCQKKDWKNGHNRQCDRSWAVLKIKLLMTDGLS
eukprot:227618_1